MSGDNRQTGGPAMWVLLAACTAFWVILCWLLYQMFLFWRLSHGV